MIITLDLETIPAQNEAVRELLASGITAPANYSKPESIAKWEQENKPALVEEAWRKTSFDGAYGQIAVAGIAFDDEEPIALFSKEWQTGEKEILVGLNELISERLKGSDDRRHRFVGHNIVGFDLRFLFQRSVINGVRPSAYIPFTAKPWDEAVYDTMTAWAGVGQKVSMDKVCKALGMEGKGEIDGSKVWDYVQAGRIKEVAEYCKDDVRRTRAMFQRMNFVKQAA